jgi:hypothetical protein
MKKAKVVLAVVALLLAGFLLQPANPVKAASNWAGTIQAVPCRSISTFRDRNPTVVRCAGYSSRFFELNVPVPRIQSYPQYPLVGLPVVFEVGLYQESFLTGNNGPNTLTFPGEERFEGYRVEARLQPHIMAAAGFHNNMAYGGDARIRPHPYESFYSGAGCMGSLARKDLELGALNICKKEYGRLPTAPPGDRVDYYGSMHLAGTWFWSLSQVASHEGSTDWQGNPAYKLTVRSEWDVYGRAIWDQHYTWGIVRIDRRCGPPVGSQPNDCKRTARSVGFDGKRREVIVYGWIPDDVMPSGTWAYVNTVWDNKVINPDGTEITDEYAVLYLQSQPLLQSP